jgi:hypothetical protein
VCPFFLPCARARKSTSLPQVADDKTRKAANELLLLLCPPAPAPAAGAKWKAAAKVVTSVAVVAAAVPAATAVQEAKQPKPKRPVADAPPPDAPDPAAEAANKLAQRQARDKQELEKARKFWQDWKAAKGEPEPNYWSPDEIRLWCVGRARSVLPSVIRVHEPRTLPHCIPPSCAGILLLPARCWHARPALFRLHATHARSIRARVLGMDGAFFQKYASVFEEVSDYDDVVGLLADPVSLEKRVAEAIDAFVAASGKSGSLKNRTEVEEAGVTKLRRKLEALKCDIDVVRNGEAKAAAAAQLHLENAALLAGLNQLEQKVVSKVSKVMSDAEANIVKTVVDAEGRVRSDIAAGFKEMKKFIFNLSERSVPCVVLVAPATKGKAVDDSLVSFRKLLRTLSTSREDAFRLHVLCEYGEPHFIDGHAGYPLHGTPGPRMARVLALVRGSVMVLKTANFVLSALMFGTTVVPSGWLDKVVEACKREKVSADVQRALLPQLRKTCEPGADKLDDAALSKQLNFESGGVDANTLAALTEFLDDAERCDPNLDSWRKHLYR